MSELTQAEARYYFDYNPETGDLFWKNPTGKRIQPGRIAGAVDDDGYRQVKIDGKRYSVHRLIWCWNYGDYPEDEIDHINHNRSDNRLCNLRDVTRKENSQNISMKSNNSSGVMGVHFNRIVKKWHAKINVDKKSISLGYFEDLDKAAIARKQAEIKYGFNSNHGKSAQ